MHMPYLPITTK